MGKHRIAGSVGLLLCFFSTFVKAAETVAEPILVTATRTARSANETLASVTVISRAEIERSQALDIAGLLRLYAGLEISRNGGPGQLTTLFTRGTDSNQTLVLLDGVRINPGTIGGAPLQNINPELIDRIEIVRGPRSTLYGSDAIGGVVQIFTRRTTHGTSGSAYLGTGSDSTYSGGASLQGAKNNLRAGFDIGYLSSDGFPPRTDSNIESSHDNLSTSMYLGYSNARWDVELSRWSAAGNTEYLDFFLAPLDQDFENTVTALTVRATSGGIWVPTLKLSHMKEDIRQQQNNDFSRTRRNILDWQNDIAFDNHHLITTGLYLLREETDSLSFGTGFNEDTDVNAVFAQDQMQFGRHQLLVAGRYTDHDSFNNEGTWNLAYGYRVNPATRIFTSVGTAFRAPDASDRFGFGGNPDLKPEKSRNIEFGIQRQWGNHHSLHVTVFHNEVDDLIVFNDPDGFLGPIAGKNENVEKARMRGIEAQYALRRQNLSVQIAATIQDPENRDTGNNLARRAERNITATAYYDFGRFEAGLEWLASSDRRDSDFSDAELPGYGLLNVNVRVPLSRDLTVLGKIENLLDKEYFLADTFNNRDRAFYLTLRYQPQVKQF
ncbi:MAG: TonB-dependent receptor [Gammaproteobacteria bacterium]